jgi:hypothetical protein
MHDKLNDEMDVYLGRCVKNWAAQQKPTAGSREALLRAVVCPSAPEQTLFSHLLAILKDRYLYPEQVVHYQPEWRRGPLTLSAFWSFELASNCRISN